MSKEFINTSIHSVGKVTIGYNSFPSAGRTVFAATINVFNVEGEEVYELRLLSEKEIQIEKEPTE